MRYDPVMERKIDYFKQLNVDDFAEFLMDFHDDWHDYFESMSRQKIKAKIIRFLEEVD